MKNINKESLKKEFKERFLELIGKRIEDGTKEQKYYVLGSLVREYLMNDWLNTQDRYKESNQKEIYYFSMEFLIGRLLNDSLLNLGIRKICKEALADLNIDLTELEELENDQGLGNGGLGRLAACFLDSMSSLGIAGHGCGIRYKYGFFNQKIIDGKQVEFSDNWLQQGNPWEIKKRDEAEIVKFGGEVRLENINNKLIATHYNYEAVLAVPYDTPITGYNNGVINTLRLWSAEAIDNEFKFDVFSRGDFIKAYEYKNSVESISSILYPNDSSYEGKVLRLKQEYFFVSAGLQSIIKKYKKNNGDIRRLNEKIAIHINDTHPALVIPELIRILIDEEGLSWEEAWDITNRTVAYTNHTILSEALEKWPIDMVKMLLPRIYMIIEEINERFCKELWSRYPGDWSRIARMAIIADGYVKMAHLSIVGSHSVNGVAKLHTEILKKREMVDFYNYYPQKFNNKTNGINHRRWLLKINPKLKDLLIENIGESFIKDPLRLIEFKDKLKDKLVLEGLCRIKLDNKINLANYIYNTKNIKVDPRSIFDTQIKRIHGYKRQILNCLRIMDLYNRIIENPCISINSRTFIFAGKAAPGYLLAKNVIELINVIADKINNDKRVNDKIKVIFMENYNVSLAEKIIPATDLSEQISMATKEASGTSNMKFMMNGALTIATLDGANIEIKENVGEDNIIIFGTRSEEVLEIYNNHSYYSYDLYNKDYRIKRVVDSLVDGTYSSDKDRFRIIYDNLLKYNDEFLVLKDFNSYLEAQEEVDKLYNDRCNWQKKCGINIASSGVFSSDRTILEYFNEIWN
ncbi:glycogen/starch/alpha-glucan phosphorylase [Caproiciproducens sp. MSJ-32]|uniref:glycogen/starch/alpha-glucan phosphorylase n=1 Tax=Caproiciproducens sp. MSJ-32 TaxID=2841527 RepID=UPI002ED3723F